MEKKYDKESILLIYITKRVILAYKFELKFKIIKKLSLTWHLLEELFSL